MSDVPGMPIDAPNLKYKHLYVVVRVEPLDHAGSIVDQISVVSAFSDQKAAENDARRLNNLNGAKGYEYSVFITRLKDENK